AILKDLEKNYNTKDNFYLDFEYGENIKTIKEDVEMLSEGIDRYGMESYKLNDKNESNNSNIERYFVLDIKEEADFKNKRIMFLNYLVNGDGKKAGISNFNHNYFESIDSLNPQDPFTDYENTSIMNSIKNSEFQNVESPTFSTGGNNQNQNINNADFYERNVKCIKILGYLVQRSRETAVSAEGKLLKFDVRNNGGILRKLIKSIKIPLGIKIQDQLPVHNDPSNANNNGVINILYLPQSDALGNHVDVESNFKDSKFNSLRNHLQSNIKIDDNYGFILTPTEYNSIYASYKDFYTAITIGNIEDGTGNLYTPPGNGQKGKLAFYVFNKDKNGDNIKIKNPLKAGNQHTINNHVIVMDKVINMASHFTNACSQGGNSAAGTSSSRVITKRADNVRCPCNKAKYSDLNKYKNKFDNTKIENMISSLTNDLKLQEYEEAINEIDKRESKFKKATADMMDSQDDKIDMERRISGSGENKKNSYIMMSVQRLKL
ncbi:hypothetical protein BCR36DRAFT_452538, partial [Piromyces finnis]